MDTVVAILKKFVILLMMIGLRMASAAVDLLLSRASGALLA